MELSNVEKKSPSLPKVLFHNPVAFIGGGEVGLLNILKALSGVVLPVVILPEDGLLTAELKKLKVPVEIVPFPSALARVSRVGNKYLKMLRGLPLLPAYLHSLNEVIKRHQPTLLYSNGLKSHFLLAVLAKWTNIPLFCHVRDVLSNVPGLHYLLANVAKEVITNSSATLSALELSEGQGVIIPNAIDLEVHFSDQKKGGPSIIKECQKRGNRLIVTAGKLAPLKGFDTVIRAFHSLRKAGEAVELAIAGSEDYVTQAGHLNELQDLVKELQLGDTVSFLGNVSPLAPLLAKADLFVLASKSEGFGRVVAEAMAANCPVVVSSVGGLPNLVGKAGERGLLAPPGDIAAFSQSMKQSLVAKRETEARVLAARSYVEENLTLAKLKERLTTLLFKELGEPWT